MGKMEVKNEARNAWEHFKAQLRKLLLPELTVGENIVYAIAAQKSLMAFKIANAEWKAWEVEHSKGRLDNRDREFLFPEYNLREVGR